MQYANWNNIVDNNIVDNNIVDNNIVDNNIVDNNIVDFEFWSPQLYDATIAAAQVDKNARWISWFKSLRGTLIKPRRRQLLLVLLYIVVSMPVKWQRSCAI